MSLVIQNVHKRQPDVIGFSSGMSQNCDLLILIPGSESVPEGSGVPSFILSRGKKASFLTGLCSSKVFAVFKQ